MKYNTLKELKAAYDSGELDKTKHQMFIDDESAYVFCDETNGFIYRHGRPVYEGDLLDECLELLGIPIKSN